MTEPTLPVDLADRFDLLERLSAGAGGLVVICQDRWLKRHVVLKLFHGHALGDDIARRRFVREGRLLAELEDPRVVRIFDLGETGGIPYLVMEHLAGLPLDRFIRQQAPLSPIAACAIAGAMAGALALLEERGIVHRDVKPGNTMMVPGRGPVLIDFGLAALGGAAVVSGNDPLP